MGERGAFQTSPRAPRLGSRRNAASITAGLLWSSTAVDALRSSEHWPASQRARIGQVAPRFFAQQHELPKRTRPRPLARATACSNKSVAIARRTALIVAGLPNVFSSRLCHHRPHINRRGMSVSSSLQPVIEVRPEGASAAQPWPLAKRFAFTFTSILFFLQNFPFPFDYIPAFYKTIFWTDKLWDIGVAPMAKHVFHVATGAPGGGDSVWRYVEVALFFAIALAGGLLWAVLDRKRSRYERAYELCRIYLRY